MRGCGHAQKHARVSPGLCECLIELVCVWQEGTQATPRSPESQPRAPWSRTGSRGRRALSAFARADAGAQGCRGTGMRVRRDAVDTCVQHGRRQETGSPQHGTPTDHEAALEAAPLAARPKHACAKATALQALGTERRKPRAQRAPATSLQAKGASTSERQSCGLFRATNPTRSHGHDERDQLEVRDTENSLGVAHGSAATTRMCASCRQRIAAQRPGRLAWLAS